MDEDGESHVPAVLARRSTTWAALRAWGRLPQVVANVEEQLEAMPGVTAPFDEMPVVVCVYDGAVYTATDGGRTWTESSRELVLNINPGGEQANMGVVIMGDPATGGWDPTDMPAPAAP